MVANGRTAPGKSVPLDDVSKKIIEQLQVDGRRSYAEIGKAVGLSEAAVRQRVQKLTDAGVMQVVAVTDPMQLGFFRQAMIGIRATGDTRVLADLLAAMPAVDYVVLTRAPSTSSPRSSARTTTNCSNCSTPRSATSTGSGPLKHSSISNSTNSSTTGEHGKK